MILDGRYSDGDAMPSVRSLAAESGANPLTVAKAYHGLIEAGVVRTRRGVGLFVAEGGRSRLLLMEKTRFLADDWPRISAEIRRLRLRPQDLIQKASKGT